MNVAEAGDRSNEERQRTNVWMLAEVVDELVPVGAVTAIMLPVAAVFLVAGLRLRGISALAPVPVVFVDLLPLGRSEEEAFLRAVEAEGVWTL